MFRTYQGWLALSETAPNEGTLQVFPNVMLSNPYMIVRPFFALKEGAQPDSFDPNDWRFGMVFKTTCYVASAYNRGQTPRLRISTVFIHTARRLLAHARTPRHTRI